jgi:hypothetical protein
MLSGEVDSQEPYARLMMRVKKKVARSRSFGTDRSRKHDNGREGERRRRHGREALGRHGRCASVFGASRQSHASAEIT